MPGKKQLLLILFLWLPGMLLMADSRLTELINGKQWTELSRQFSDNSWQLLEEYFKKSLSIRFVTYPTNKLTYKAKFKTYGEIGTLIYEKKEDKYLNLEIKNQIKPLIFIENFKQYRVFNKKISLGDASLFFRDGHFYLSHPFGQVLFFVGDWEFSITPSDPEEQVTLTRLFKENSIRKSGNWGILILKDKTFLSDTAFQFQSLSRNSPVHPLLTIYREFFGIQIKQFKEFWYLPFKGEDNLIIFKKDKKSFYLYDFNQTISPDTRLRISENNKIILNYNAIRQPKFMIRKKDRVSQIHLNLFYNPESDFLSGTALMSFETPSSFRILNLDEGLKIKASLDLTLKGLSVIRKGKAYYFLGPRTNTLSFFYQGNIEPEIDCTDIFKRQTLEIETIERDKFYFLSNAQHFFPNTDLDFFKSRLTISLPNNFSCLASGQLMRSRQSTRNTFQFESSGIKGLTIACGEFNLIKKIESRIPIKIFSTAAGVESKHFHLEAFTEPLKKFKSRFDLVSKYFNFKKLKESLDFLVKHYGGLDISEINMLLRKDIQEGGVSNKGFIFFNYNPDLSLSQRITRKSPIILSQDPTNHLIHELAHQWWGGMISWNSYEDVWITEGFAQFSLLFFLEKTLSKKKFKRILKRLKKEIYRVNEFGPVVYGKRILTIHDDYEAYQTIVYNKAAFVLLMLKDMIGEKEFFKRIRTILKTGKYKSMTTMDFIRQFSKKSPLIFKFLNHWITRRKIPEISVSIQKKHHMADITIRQTDQAAVFPLTLKIKTGRGMVFHTITIKEKNQYIPIRENSIIESIQINDLKTLVKIKN